MYIYKLGLPSFIFKENFSIVKGKGVILHNMFSRLGMYIDIESMSGIKFVLVSGDLWCEKQCMKIDVSGLGRWTYLLKLSFLKNKFNKLKSN